MQNITAERDQYQNILNDENRQVQDLRNQLGDSRNQNLRLQRLLDESQIQAERIMQMHTDALNNETKARREFWQLAQNRQERIGELLRENFVCRLLIQRKDTQIAEHRRTAHRLTVRYNNDTERWRRRHAGCVHQAQNWKGQYRNSQNQVWAHDQNILNLQGQILVLQNNPLLNMANAHLRRLPLLKILNPNLGKFQSYTGQEPPDEYLDKVIQSWAHLEGHMTLLEDANAGDFDNAYKCEIFKSMMGGKYTPVPANNGLVAGNPAINTPDTLRAWMRAKYQRETVGNQQSAIQRLTQERFQSYDTPDTYETRIRSLLLGVADNDAQVLGFLKSQLSGDLYTWMRIANPAGIDAFFTELKNLWLERPPNLNGVQTSQNNLSAEIEKLNSQIASLQAQLA